MAKYLDSAGVTYLWSKIKEQIGKQIGSHAGVISSDNVLGHIKSKTHSGGVTLNSTSTAGRYYPVYTDSDGVAFVNIPWTDTKYTHPNSGVTAGTYRSVTVNAQGHVTSGTNPTTLAGYEITDAYTKTETNNLLGGYLKLSGGVRVLTEGITIQDSNTTANNISISGNELSIGGSATMNIGPNTTVTGLGSYPTDAGSGNRIASTKYVIDAINNKLAVADALIFKGVVSDTTPLPTKNYKQGWTYKVAKAGTYAGNKCEVGDMIIAIADYDTSFKNTDWTVIQNNVDVAGKDTLGLVKTTSTVTNNSGYTATRIVDGVPYYKDTNTSHTHDAGAGITLSGSGGTSGKTTITLKKATADDIGGGKVYEKLPVGETAGNPVNEVYLKISIDNDGCFCAAYPSALTTNEINIAIGETPEAGGGIS